MENAESKIGLLGMFEAIISNRHYSNSFINTLAYPQYLLYSAIIENGPLPYENVANVKGLKFDVLGPMDLVDNLKRMGLIEEVGGHLKSL